MLLMFSRALKYFKMPLITHELNLGSSHSKCACYDMKLACKYP